MKLWLAVNRPLELEPFISLDVCEAETEDEAFNIFSHRNIYAWDVLELPDTVVLRTEMREALFQADCERFYMDE